MSRSSLRCEECGGKLTLFVVGVCERCSFDLTGEDDERDERDARMAPRAPVSPPNGKDA